MWSESAVRGNAARCLQWKAKRTVGGPGQHRRTGPDSDIWLARQGGAASEVRLVRNRYLLVRLKVSMDVLGADHLAPIDQ